LAQLKLPHFGAYHRTESFGYIKNVRTRTGNDASGESKTVTVKAKNFATNGFIISVLLKISVALIANSCSPSIHLINIGLASPPD
jgi:hypothetical protein